MSTADEHARIAAEIVRAHDGSDPFAAAARATRMPMVISDPRLPDNPIVFVNDAFLLLTGYRRAEILGRNCRFLQGPATDTESVARIRDAVAIRTTIEIDLLNHRKDGSVFWNRVLISPVRDENGDLTYFFASQLDVTLEKDSLVRLQRDRDELEREVARRTAQLTRSEDRLRFALKAGRLGSWTIDIGTMGLEASDDCKLSFGRSAAESFTYDDFSTPSCRPTGTGCATRSLRRSSAEATTTSSIRSSSPGARPAGSTPGGNRSTRPTARRTRWRASPST